MLGDSGEKRADGIYLGIEGRAYGRGGVWMGLWKDRGQGILDCLGMSCGRLAVFQCLRYVCSP